MTTSVVAKKHHVLIGNVAVMKVVVEILNANVLGTFATVQGGGLQKLWLNVQKHVQHA